MGRFFRRYWLAFAIAILFVALWAGLWANRYSRMGLTTVLLLPDLFVDSPLSPLKLGEEPLRQEVTIPGPDGPFFADIYRPADGDAHGAVLLAVGAVPRIREHPGAIRLSKAAARAGIAVMLPELNNLERDIMNPEDLEVLVAAFRYLRSQPYVDPQRSGIVGVSVGAGLAVGAAADARIRSDVHFLLSIGGYFDIWDVIAAATTGTIYDDGRAETWQPRAKTIAVLQRSLISYLNDPDERDLFTRYFVEDDLTAIINVGSLSPEAALLYEILTNSDPSRAQDLFARLSPQRQAILRQLSPRAHVQALEAEFFIMHDRSDPYLPYVESRRLRDALAGNGSSLHYAEFAIFEHVEPTNWTDPLTFIANISKLLFYAWLLLLRLI